MTYRSFWFITPFILISCATETTYNPLDDYEEVDSVTILDAPRALAGGTAPENRDAIARGEYLVELLGCGACHTEGALVGEPRMDRSLGGSRIGIAYTNPLEHRNPGVVYPSNITPDKQTGIGLRSDTQIADAIRAGLAEHGRRAIRVMPWQGYAKLSADDSNAIVGYLRNIKEIQHRVPDEVPPGRRAREPFVYFGIYRSR